MLNRSSDMIARAVHEDTLSVFMGCAEEFGLRVVFRHRSPMLWQRVLDRSSYLPVIYTEKAIHYQLAYLSQAPEEIVDVSIVLMHENQPVGVWPIFLRINGECQIRSHEGDVLPPLFAGDLSGRTRRDMINACLGFLEFLGRSLNAWQSWRGVEYFCGEHDVSPWHCALMKRGALTNVRHDLYVDLSLELAVIKASLRKSYRSLITSGSKLWTVETLRDVDPAVWMEFRLLHQHVAGRETRGIDTWNMQSQAISDRSAFLVYLRDTAGRMVGGGFFNLSRDEGVYGVGAYDRSLFDKPLGHVVQWFAIQEMKARAVRWYRIGPRAFPGDQPTPTDKELAIAKFKEGFATHTFFSVQTILNCPSQDLKR